MEMSEGTIKAIAREEYNGLKESYPSITPDYMEEVVRKLLEGEEVKGVIAMFVRRDLEEVGLIQ